MMRRVAWLGQRGVGVGEPMIGAAVCGNRRGDVGKEGLPLTSPIISPSFPKVRRWWRAALALHCLELVDPGASRLPADWCLARIMAHAPGSWTGGERGLDYGPSKLKQQGCAGPCWASYLASFLSRHPLASCCTTQRAVAHESTSETSGDWMDHICFSSRSPG